jgi:CRP-like cAMP-binding protein
VDASHRVFCHIDRRAAYSDLTLSQVKSTIKAIERGVDLGFEVEPIQMEPFSLEREDDSLIVIGQSQAHAEIEMPLHLAAFLERLSQGFTFQQCVLWLLQHGRKFTFSDIFRCLEQLCDARLVRSPKVRQAVERLRPNHVWRRSILQKEFYSEEILNIRANMPIAAVGLILLALVSVTGLYSILQIYMNFNLIRDGFAQVSTYWIAFLVGFVVFSIVRSLRSLLQFVLVQVISGRAARLSLKLTPISVHLSTQELSMYAPKNSLEFIAGISCFIVTGWGVGIGSIFGFSGYIHGMILFFSLLLYFIDGSPFIKSECTDLLRYWYNFGEERKAKAVKVRNEGMANLHVIASVIWVALFGMFMVFAFEQVKVSFLVNLRSDVMSIKASALLFTIALAVIFISLVDDILNSVFYGGENEHNVIRQYWLQKNIDASENKSVESISRADIEELPLIRLFPQDMRERILREATLIKVGKGLRICKQGSNNRDLYVLISGQAVVIRRSASGEKRVMALLEPGSVFGETGFFLGKPRTADVLTSSDSQILVIKHQSEFRDVEESKAENLKHRIWFLQAMVASPLFREIPSEAFDQLLFYGQIQRIPPGRTVIKEGDVGDRCYFIIQGEADVFQRGRKINAMARGDMFGEIAILMKNNIRTATVQAVSDMIVVELSRDHFWEVLSRNLALALQVERLASLRFHRDLS